MGPMSEQNSGQPSPPVHHVDPVIVDTVRSIANRFGAQGLDDLITLATDELQRARAALEELASEE